MNRLVKEGSEWTKVEGVRMKGRVRSIALGAHCSVTGSDAFVIPTWSHFDAGGHTTHWRSSVLCEAS